MPDFSWSTALTANQLDQRPLANWKYRRLPFRALVTIMQRATGVSVRETIDSGAQNIKQKAPVAGGGTAGKTPIPQKTPGLEVMGDGGGEVTVSEHEGGGL